MYLHRYHNRIHAILMFNLKSCKFQVTTKILIQQYSNFLYVCSDENVKAIEFMNTKKSHEVQAMSELICSIADYCGLKQVRIFPYKSYSSLVSLRFPFLLLHFSGLLFPTASSSPQLSFPCLFYLTKRLHTVLKSSLKDLS